MADQENRLRYFKNKGKDFDERRRIRADNTFELRKAKKEESLMKRRNVATIDASPLSPKCDAYNANVIENIEQISSAIFSPDINDVLLATRSARRMVSKERNPPLDTVINAGLVPRFVELLSCEALDGDIQFEASWALTNIASGTPEQTMCVVEKGGLPAFVALLSHSQYRIAEQAVWALGNIAGDGASMRDLVLKAGVLPHLIKLSNVKLSEQSSLLRNVTWTLSNLCRNKPAPHVEVIEAVLPTIKRLLSFDDQQILIDACWSLSYLSDGPDQQIQLVLDAQVLDRLITLLSSSELKILTPVLRTVGNIVTGNEDQTQAVIDAGALPLFATLLVHPRSNIVKEASWATSNIAAGSSGQIESLLKAGLLELIIDVIDKGDFKCQKEACWAISNITTGGTITQILTCVAAGLLKPFCKLLAVNDTKILEVILDGIRNILSAARQVDKLEQITTMIEEVEGLDKLEHLQYIQSDEIYNKAFSILDEFFPSEENQIEAEGDAYTGGASETQQQSAYMF